MSPAHRASPRTFSISGLGPAAPQQRFDRGARTVELVERALDHGRSGCNLRLVPSFQTGSTNGQSARPPVRVSGLSLAQDLAEVRIGIGRLQSPTTSCPTSPGSTRDDWCRCGSSVGQPGRRPRQTNPSRTNLLESATSCVAPRASNSQSVTRARPNPTSSTSPRMRNTPPHREWPAHLKQRQNGPGFTRTRIHAMSGTSRLGRTRAGTVEPRGLCVYLVSSR